MNETQIWLIIGLQIGGHVVTVGALMLANVRAAGRTEERVKGLGRALDSHKEGNENDHDRFQRHLEDQGRHSGRVVGPAGGD